MATWGGILGSHDKSRRKRHRCIPLEDEEGTGRNQQQEVTLSLFIHLTDGAEWFTSQVLRGMVEIQSQQKDQQPGKLWSSQMDTQVTGHQISHTVPHKAAG